MPVIPPTMIVLRTEDAFAPCVDYVLRLFARMNRWNAVFTDTRHAQSFLAATHRPCVVLHYSSGDTTFDGDEWEGRCDLFVRIQRGPFFGRRFLELPDLPESAGTLRGLADQRFFRTAVLRAGKHTLRLSFDLIASAFWFLTRYEEYVTSTPDEHGRFLCEHSMAPPECYNQPLVNLWFDHLAGIIREELKLPEVGAPRQTIALTHDIDLMRKYRGLRGARRALSTMVQSTVSDATGEMRVASLVLAGIRRDPYDSFDQLFGLKDRIGAPSTFFLMGGRRTPYDCDYMLDDLHVRELITRIRSFGDEIGVHPSYDSSRSEQIIRREATMVSESVGQPVQVSRQHYLRFSIPETWRALAAAGIRCDSSVAFADHAGFRCGWAGCFRPFDIEKRTEIPLLEIPLIVMDVTVANYEKIPSERAIERVAKLLDASAVQGGAFVLLWHNTLRDERAYPGYWDSLEYFAFAAAGHARFVTLSRLADEYDQLTGTNLA